MTINSAISPVLFYLLLVFSFSSCNREAERPNLIMFIADDLSYEDLGCYHHPLVRTPHVDQFAKEGLNMTHMFTSTAMCAPSRSAMYTGLYPHRNGCHMNHGRVKEGIQSIPHYLKPLGYHVALVNKRHIKPAESFPFDYLHKDSVEQYLSSLDKEPFCLIFASDEPHGPHAEGRIEGGDIHQLPPTWVNTPETRATYATYLNDVEKMDREFGALIALLKKQGLYDNSVSIFTSDHGYEYFAKWTCYETGLRVPFIIRWNKLESGAQNHAMASFIDILPTFIELAGGSPPENIDGSSLQEVFMENKFDHREFIFGSHTNRGIISGKAYPVRSVRDREYKYIKNLNSDNLFQNVLTHGWTYNPDDAAPVWKSWLRLAEKDELIAKRVFSLVTRPPEELYDLLNDPYELNNLAGEPSYTEIKSTLSSVLDQWMRDQGDEGLKTEMKVPLWKAKP